MSNSYLVTITNESGAVCGQLQEAGNSTNCYNFNPLTSLGDLLNIATYSGTSPYPQDNYSFTEDYLKHPFFFGREYTGNPLFKKPYSFRHFFVAVNELKEIITNDSRFSMSQFEILKQFLSLGFTSKIEFREENPLYELGYKVNSLNSEVVEKYQYVSVSYTYSYDMDSMFGENSETPHKFTYTCYSVEDIIFSVLHYLTLLEYGFKRCDHCDNYFATKTFKVKYCNRYSPYKGRENLLCNEAVDRIMTHITKRRNSIKTSLYNYHGDAASDFLYEFTSHAKAIKSVHNLKTLEHITSKDYVKQKWYKEEYKNKKS